MTYYYDLNELEKQQFNNLDLIFQRSNYKVKSLLINKYKEIIEND